MHVAKRICGDVSWVGFTLWRRIRQKTLGLKRLFVRPALPVSPDGKVRIRFGCGDIASPEFINVEAVKGV
jgi:hypothetical protein